MYQSEQAAFEECMRDLCEAHNRPITDRLVRVYWDALKDLPLMQVRGIAKAKHGEKQFPKPHDLRPSNSNAKPVRTPNPADLIEAYLERTGRGHRLRRPCEHTWFGRDGAITGVLLHGDEHYPEERVTLADIPIDLDQQQRSA